ncbi:acetylating acetaldehyde dehydrogenase [Agarilytica rhodophyticola]|uniref:acetylating acetaldehyde dehydrogenase n=1 Tax=Agarilytica rhodophyticola TaxID=1737490 RepID=UPI000B348A56|nr:acetylating acetaldehyde dehydrogenase [Agarilytica rhodophyticola]
MQLNRAVPSKRLPRFEKKAPVNNDNKIKVGILGTGKIGVDLLVKALRSKYMDCIMFAGRNSKSEGIQYAKKLGVTVSDRSINAFIEADEKCDVIFDATSASQHVNHAPLFKEMGVLAIDMTPSQIGTPLVPAISLADVKNSSNISMISCGGQSSIPIAYALSLAIPEITRLHVASYLSPNSVGPATLANLDEYYSNTRAGLRKYSGIKNIDVDLIVDDKNFASKMRNVIFAETSCTNLDLLDKALNDVLKKVQHYVPGYCLEGCPIYENGGVKINISVEGRGDYLPKYAGNLDIINCAAIAVAEEYAMLKNYFMFPNVALVN